MDYMDYQEVTGSRWLGLVWHGKAVSIKVDKCYRHILISVPYWNAES